MPRSRPPIILCELLPETRDRIEAFAEDLKRHAPQVGTHGLTEQEFWDSGIFRSAIERLRGTQAASTSEKREFVRSVLDHLQTNGEIRRWEFSGSGERHDYDIEMSDGTRCVVEAKGCLDGNNTNIFQRPPQADEFLIWSLCQNPGSDPRHNAWSGIHTRLGAEIIHRKQKVDGLIIWDMVCGTRGRPCPKLNADPTRGTTLPDGKRLPPPCLYLFPRSIPDPRNNPTPACWRLEEVKLLHALWRAFRGNDSDVVEVRIEARMEGPNLQRRTRFLRDGVEFYASDWTTLRRAQA
jgi:hypothetical protein